MPSRIDVIAEARRWVGTPFHHQAMARGQGVDCAGLVAGVGLALGLVPDLPSHMRRYGRVPHPARMRAVIEQYLSPVEAPEPGDILFMGWRPGRPMHLGILTDLHGRGILHAFSDAGQVVETAFPAAYVALVDSWWQFRGLEK